MSYLAVNNYKQGARYYLTLNILNDAKYLATSSSSPLAQKINLFCTSLIEYYEKNIDIALNLIKFILVFSIPIIYSNLFLISLNLTSCSQKNHHVQVQE